MVRKGNLSSEQRLSVVILSKEGYSGHAIARKHKISVCGVQAILRKALTTGTVEDRDMSGCTPSTIAGEDRLFYRLSLSNRTTTSRMLQKRDLEDVTGAQLFSKTVRRRLVKLV